MVRKRSLIGLVACLGAFHFSVQIGYAQSDDQQRFYLGQYANALKALEDPGAANRRVINMWSELNAYSHRAFLVIPAQQYDAGRATVNGIYLDLAIAADPSPEVTRFFLAHEWGHMMHGDPIVGMSALQYLAPYSSSTAVEDSADAYAAKFMSDHSHDIRPVLEFLCSIPNAGPSDPHSSGSVRAANVAKFYGYASANPCSEAQNDPGQVLAREIKAIAFAAQDEFKSLRGTYVGDSTYRLKVPITLDGKDSTCEVSGNPEESGICDFDIHRQDDDEATAAFEALTAAISKALPNWTRTDREDSDSSSDLLGVHRWWASSDARFDHPHIELRQRHNSHTGKGYVVLTFHSPVKD